MQIPILTTGRILRPSIPRINWADPITFGLLGVYLPGILRGYGLLGPLLSNGGDGPGAWGTTADGASLNSLTSGANIGLITTTPLSWQGSPAYTVYFRGVIVGAGNSFGHALGLSYTNSDTNPYLACAISTDSSSWATAEGFANSGGSGQTTAQVDISGHYGQMISLSTSYNAATNLTFWVNGKIAAQSTAFGSAPSFGTSQILINQYVPTTSRSTNTKCNAGYFWRRELSQAEQTRLSLDPYCFLIFPEDEIMASLVGATAQGFTWSQTGDDQLFLPKQHTVREMIRHD